MPFCVDIDRRKIEVMNYERSSILYDMKCYGVSTIQELNNKDIDRVIFERECDAEKFCDGFHYQKARLMSGDFSLRGKSKSSLSLLMKRRYLVLMLMGLKNCTVRSHNRHNLKKGDITFFYDQTYCVRVKITDIQITEKGAFRYVFALY